jgi:hypothetical protein
VQFVEKGYVSCMTDIIIKYLNKLPARVVHTINKKNQVVVIFRDGQWKKLNLMDFSNEVSKIVNQVVRGCIPYFKKLTNTKDETIVIIMDDTNQYKEKIAKNLIEYCGIL